MEANIQLIQKRRFYSKEFKQQLVTEFESGKFSVAQLHRLYGVSIVSFYNISQCLKERSFTV